MATLTLGAAASTGLDFNTDAVAVAAGGDEFANSGRELVLIRNDDANPTTVTVTTTMTVDDAAVADLAVVVPAGESRLLGPFTPALYNDTASGRVAMTYSNSTSIFVLAFTVALP